MPAHVVTTESLLHMSVTEIMTLFKSLDAPTLDEMHGEYQATLLKQPSLLTTISGQLAINDPIILGKWQCKAFRPVNDEFGVGYNSFKHFGKIKQHFPMRTLIAASRYDNRPAYQLVYRAFYSLCGQFHMVDEIRKVNEGLYLGIGTYGFTDKQRQVPLPFLLSGPQHEYRGDIGKERKRFNLAKEVPSLRNS